MPDTKGESDEVWSEAYIPEGHWGSGDIHFNSLARSTLREKQAVL